MVAGFALQASFGLASSLDATAPAGSVASDLARHPHLQSRPRLKGDGDAADNIADGPEHSTLANDALLSREFDFML